MKYLLLATMFLASAVFANEAKVLSKQEISLKKNSRIVLRTVCVDGYKFLITGRYDREYIMGEGVALAMQYDTTQMFENQNGVSVPSEC